ncbi:MAG: hypothetical protein RIM84_03045 [Alphaproteobacteria bacterium]
MPPDILTHIAGLAWLIAVFLAICGALVAGYGPYSDSMGDMLRVAGLLLLGAASLAGLGVLLKRFADRAHDE